MNTYKQKLLRNRKDDLKGQLFLKKFPYSSPVTVQNFALLCQTFGHAEQIDKESHKHKKITDFTLYSRQSTRICIYINSKIIVWKINIQQIHQKLVSFIYGNYPK